MTARLATSRPLRFATGVGFGWIALRLAALLLPLPFLAGLSPRLLAGAGPLALTGRLAAEVLPAPRTWPEPAFVAEAPAAPRGPLADPAERASLIALAHLAAVPAGLAIARNADEAWAVAVEPPARGSGAAVPPADRITPAELAGVPLLAPHDRRFSGSAWLFARGGSGRGALASGGQLGGSQAGARLAYSPLSDVPVAIYMRGSAALGGVAGTEAALGIEWRPFGKLPLSIGIERRIAIDKGGRNAFAAIVAGGLYDQPMPLGTRLDGYGQAGIVGFKRHDLFVDGGIRIGRRLPLRKDATVTVGGGVWGGAQPHVARLDVGPQATMHVPIGHSGISAAADWRFRVAGNARPGSGPALTIGADF